MSDRSAAAGLPAADPSLAAALRWPPASEKFLVLAGAALLAFAGYQATFLWIAAVRLESQPITDFFGLWSAARFLSDHPAAAVYDPAALKSAQVALGMDAAGSYPFPYPPSFLLALRPFGLLPLLAAEAVMVGASLLLFLWATVGRRWLSLITVAALVAPTTTTTVVAGQAGFLAAALLVGGFRLAPRRPYLAGFLFGLATYKPQMGILVPVALIAAAWWRTISAACLTVVAMVLLTSAVFGPAIWPVWAVDLVAYSHQFAAENSEIAYLMPTVSAALTQWGAATPVVVATQLGAAAIAGGLVWRCFRAGPSPLAAAALFVATFLASPHAFVYDMPMVATAVLWTIMERHAAGESFGTGEVLVLLSAMASPISLVAGPSRVPFALVSLILLFAVVVARCERLRARRAAMPGRRAGVAFEPPPRQF